MEQRGQSPVLGGWLPFWKPEVPPHPPPDGWGAGLQNTALTARSSRRNEVKNACPLEMQLTRKNQSPQSTAHWIQTLYSCGFSPLNIPEPKRHKGVMNPHVHLLHSAMYKAWDERVFLKISSGRKSFRPLAVCPVDHPPLKAIPYYL